VTSRPPEIDLWDAARARVSAAGLWRVYDEARGEAESFDAWQAEVFDPDCDRAGFRLSVARCDHEIVGYAYGFLGERGQPWSDRVAAALPEEVATTWLGGHFRLADLAVLESHRRHGGGRRLHDVLMDGETRPALLATADADTAAVRLFTSRGWQRLGLLAEGVQVMGLRPTE
jgi:GNAT superfamily N-acetyltransferase